MDTFSGVVSVTVLSLKWYQDSGRGERERDRERERGRERDLIEQISDSHKHIKYYGNPVNRCPSKR